MIDPTYEKIADHPKFSELIRKRNRFSLILSIVVLSVYYSFVMFAVYRPADFGAAITSGSAWGTGLIVGWIIQAFALVMAGIYVRRANAEFDALKQILVEEAAR